jgi:hypothetical protein
VDRFASNFLIHRLYKAIKYNRRIHNYAEINYYGELAIRTINLMDMVVN